MQQVIQNDIEKEVVREHDAGKLLRVLCGDQKNNERSKDDDRASKDTGQVFKRVMFLHVQEDVLVRPVRVQNQADQDFEQKDCPVQPVLPGRYKRMKAQKNRDLYRRKDSDQIQQ